MPYLKFRSAQDIHSIAKEAKVVFVVVVVVLAAAPMEIKVNQQTQNRWLPRLALIYEA